MRPSRIDRRRQIPSGFEWRAETGRWRWLILGALGVAGCGGRSSGADANGSEAELQANGASAGSASTSEAGAAGVDGSGVYESGGSSDMAAGGGRATATPSACEAPFTDLGGGWEQCGNGMIHRPALGSCATSPPRPEPTTRPALAPGGECQNDGGCTDGPYGRCELGQSGGGFCEYDCVTNEDCKPGYACFCEEPIGACRPASCATDADCGDGFLCSDFIKDPGCGGQQFACQQATDECAVSSDCPDGICLRGPIGSATPADAPSYCSPPFLCTPGRPFLVAGHERLASPVARRDWYTARASRPADAAGSPSPALREAIGRGWLEQALMEHASVAAFARFSLQLLALGAPAELCSQAASAMQDEIEHARSCFELARRHLDGDVGPGPLDLAGALEPTDLRAIVLGTIAEGCIGETVAAIEAAEALAHCDDEMARPMLARLVRDETRHAELAWQFVAWALASGPATLREQVRAAFADAIQSEPAYASPSPLDRALARHGLIAPALRGELRRRVLRDVIEPCARALLALPEPVSTPSGLLVEASGLSA